MISRRYTPRALLLFALAALVVGSLPVFGLRYLNDMKFYSLFADKLLSGHVLYRDALDTKPPLVFLHYALVFALFGANNVTAVKLVTMVWLALTGLLLVRVRRMLSPAAALPALAAPLFVLASFSGWGEDFLSSNTELLANLFIVAGVYLLVAEDFTRRPLRLLAGGCAIGIACLYREQSGAALLAYASALLLRRRDFDRKLARVLWVGLGAALPAAAVVAYYAQLGALSDLRLLLALQAHYARDTGVFHGRVVLDRILVTLAGLWPLLLLALWQAVAILRRRARATRAEIFLLLFAAWSAGTFLLGRRCFPHYFVQAIPGLVLLAAQRLDPPPGEAEPPRGPRRAWFEAHALGILAAVAAVFTAINGTYYWTHKDPPPNPALVAFIETHSDPSDQVLLWAWRPDLLLATGRVFATRLLVNSPLIGHLDTPPGRARPRFRRSGLAPLWPAFLHDFVTAPPRLIIDDTPDRSRWTLTRYPRLAALLSGYHPCHVIDDTCVYVRRD